MLAVGASKTLTVEAGEEGHLVFGINDDLCADNQGEFTVIVRW